MSNPKLGGKKSELAALSLILMMTISAFGIMIPAASGATTITLQRNQSHQVIGVNQPIVLGVIPSASSFASVYGVHWGQLPTSLEYIWPSSYAVLTRPDGTNDTVQGPFELGVAHRLRFEYTPNMVGTWKVLFVWPGDEYYNPATARWTFEVQQEPIPKRDVWAFMNLRPDDKIGLNQLLLINAWVTPPPLASSEVFKDYSFVLTKPDGSQVPIGPMASEGEGTVWFEYPMDQIGQWTIKFDFPGDIHNKPATLSRTIMVQQDPVSFGYPENPRPTEEWNFPINTQNRDWRNIAGPWYMTYYNSTRGSWNPYSEAPRTAHVLWKARPTSGLGGFIGSPHSIQTGSGEAVYHAGDTGMYSSSVVNIRTVMAGRGYYTAGGRIYSVDMRNGQVLWNVPGSFNIGTTRGSQPVLYSFGSRFMIYDGLTGAVTLNVTGMAMAANLYNDPYVYSTQDYGRNRYPQDYGTTPGTEKPAPTPRIIKWTTEGTTANFTQRIVWNISLPVVTIEDGWVTIIDGKIVGVDWFSQAILTYKIWAVDEETGTIVYDKPLYDKADPNTWVYKQGPMIGSGYGKLYYTALPYENQGKGWTAYNVADGSLAWVSEKTEDPWGMFWAYLPEACAYGNIYGLSYDGVYSFDIATGKINWHYKALDPYHETPYNQYVFGSTGPVIGGGLVFAPETEHSPTFVYKGQKMHALDAFTGEDVWTIEGVYTPTALAYGILLASDSYNGFTYAFGKGSTETTVSIAAKTIANGAPVLIEGTVTDQSEGQKGTPAVSDASMTPWMEYLHMQQPKPTDATGVQVKLTATDSNGNSQDIGTTTSDILGNYAISWIPPASGVYKVTVAFEGSESYYGSTAGTSFVVSPGPSATPTPSTDTTAQSIESLGMTIIAVAVVIIIVMAIIAVLLIRKKA